MVSKITEISARKTIWTVAFTGDGRHIVGGGMEGTIRRWNVENGVEMEPTMKASGTVNALVVSKDGRWIISGDEGCKVTVWNAITHAKVLEVAAHGDHVAAVDVSSDSMRIASGGLDKTACILDLASGVQLLRPLPHDNIVGGVKFSPDGTRVATATFGASLRVYDVHSGDRLFDIPVNVENYLSNPLAWTLDGKQLFVASPGKVTCLDVPTLSRREWSTQIQDPRASLLTAKRFITCSSGLSVSFWDIISHVQIGRAIDAPGIIYSITVSPDVKYLACAHDKTITVHKLSEVLPQEYFDGYSFSEIPLMYLSDLARESWVQDDLTKAELMLSDEISLLKEHGQYSLANRALIRARLKQWSAAIDDAEESIRIQPSPIGHIAKALALIGKGERDLALQAFDYVFHHREPADNRYLLLIKAILIFVSGKHEDAVSRVEGLIAAADDGDVVHCYHQVLASMRLKQGDYERAAQTCEHARNLPSSHQQGYLVTISLIFGWSFDRLESRAWQRLCEILYNSGRMEEFFKALSRMISPLEDGEREGAHGHVLEGIITRSGEVSILGWTGKSSSMNSCLPSSPSVYNQTPYASPILEPAEMERRLAVLRTTLSHLDAVVIYDRVTRLPPIRFVHFRLHLPCIIFPVTSLRKDQDNVYRATATVLGDVVFTTEDTLPVKQSRRLVLVNPWIRDLKGPHAVGTWRDDAESDIDSDEDSARKAEIDPELVRISMVEDVPEGPLDDYTQALQLIARLGQPFSALLLLRQSDGSFKRVAADHEIIVRLASNVSRDLRAEVLEVL